MPQLLWNPSRPPALAGYLHNLDRRLHADRSSVGELKVSRARTQDGKLARGTTYEVSDDHTHKVRRSQDGAVRSYEEYAWSDGAYSEDVYPEVRIFNEHGRLVWQHRPQRVSESAEDIHVFDALGKPRVVLHHTDISGLEPCTIVEEWLE